MHAVEGMHTQTDENDSHLTYIVIPVAHLNYCHQNPLRILDRKKVKIHRAKLKQSQTCKRDTLHVPMEGQLVLEELMTAEDHEPTVESHSEDDDPRVRSQPGVSGQTNGAKKKNRIGRPCPICGKMQPLMSRHLIQAHGIADPQQRAALLEK